MKILVVCTGNRCRSQMAHGILKSIDPTLTVCSAGTRPASEVHPLGIKVMKEIGIDISSHYPKSIDQYIGEEWDYVITVCGGAKESCPVFTGKVGKRLHIGFDDPDSFKGTEEEILPEFRCVRDEIKEKMTEFVNIIKKEKNMNCPHRPSTVGETNYFECTCPKECPRHGFCCACVAHHRKMGKLPHCLRTTENNQ